MRPTTTPTAEDEFRYGWRFVNRGGDLVQVPLTLEDCLHPQEDDHISTNHQHHLDCGYLADVFRSRPLPPGSRIASDQLIDWGVPGVGNHSPEVAVLTGFAADPDPRAGTLHLKELGGRCELVVEVVSPSTRVNDVVHKLDHYFKAGVPLYVLIDQQDEEGPRSLRAYRHTPAGYEPIAPDERGRIALPPVGVLLGLRDDRAVCYDAATGEEIEDFTGLYRRREELRHYKEESQKAFEEQYRQTKDARAEAQRAQQEADSARKEADRALKEADRALKAAEDNRRRLEDAEKLLGELQEQLRRLQTGGPHNP